MRSQSPMATSGEQLHEAFVTDWRLAYAEAFVAFAVARGWAQENMKIGPDQLWQDALIDSAAKYGWCPKRTAEADVIACENETD